MISTVREAAGSLLVVGVSGTELTGLERSWLKLVKPGGTILFRRNIVDPKQTQMLLDDVTSLCMVHPVRCVDVEGGTVNRLRDALGAIPSAQAVAAADRHSPFETGNRKGRTTSKLPREHGELIARAVKAFGFNTALAPVVDLALPESAEVMGSRTAGATAANVIDYARAFLAGLAAQDIVGCGKHFPGLGGAMSDTHFETPHIKRTWRQIWDQDLVPYRELNGSMPMVMVNHAAYPQTPGKDKPASASDYWITKVLRERVGYRGLIVSDDLEMGGILKFMPVDKAAVAAVRAGSDMMLICHSAELILRTYEALIAEGERSTAFGKLLLTRAREVARKRARLYLKGTPPQLTAKQFEALRAQTTRFRESIEAIGRDAINPRAAAPAETS
jgi:beta-N-acetylhexosaminidase